MSFDQTATQIVKDSIRTAWAVDDEILEPFSEDGNAPLSKGLYHSFRQAGCLLDLARFTDFDNWTNNQMQYLATKDLLVLDWELSAAGIKFENTLKILYQALSEPGLPFVCIYTHTQDLNTIIFNILSYLWDLSFDQSNSNETRTAFLDFLADNVDDFDEDRFQQISKSSLDVFIAPHREQDIKRELGSALKDNFTAKSCGQIVQAGKVYFNTTTLCNTLAVFELLSEIYSKKGDGTSRFPVMPIDQGKTTYSYLINSTFVQLIQKQDVPGGIAPEDLYDSFAQAVYNRPHNFLSLLGLEHRNFLRDQALSLGKALNTLDEKAFFYHQSCVNEGPNGEEHFSFFLKDIWNSQAAGAWRDHSPAVLKNIDEYKTSNGLDDTVAALKSKPSLELIKSLAELNAHYSTLENIPKPPTAVRFGDIFIIEEKKVYLLCITSHCDCLRPTKISGGFLFVEGGPKNIHKGLTEAETEYVSFIHNSDVKCIKWERNPLTIYLDHENLDLYAPMLVNYREESVNMRYVCTLKENYAQRMANNAFGHANRVGISLASLIKQKE